MDFDSPPPDPIKQLEAWLRDAEGTDLVNPGAMQFATVDPDGRPSVRVLLLKGLDERGVVVYTNRESRKSRALAANPYAALAFHWDALHRQVIIEGAVTELDDAACDAYFATRPRDSQIGAWASHQSEPVSSRAELDAASAAMRTRFEGGNVPRPPYWGGYRVSLDSIEFWQAREARLHDRLRYTADGNGGWTTQRLYP